MKITNLNDFTTYALSEIPEFYDLSFEQKIEELEVLLDRLHVHELIAVYNHESEISNNFCLILPISEINEFLARMSPEEIIQMTIKGNANLNDLYFMVNDLNHLYTGNCLADFFIYTDEMAKNIVEYYLIG